MIILWVKRIKKLISVSWELLIKSLIYLKIILRSLLQRNCLCKCWLLKRPFTKIHMYGWIVSLVKIVIHWESLLVIWSTSKRTSIVVGILETLIKVLMIDVKTVISRHAQLIHLRVINYLNHWSVSEIRTVV